MMNRYFLFFVVAVACFCGDRAVAQMVGDNVFLKGNYVEIGVAPNGGYGTTANAPAGYHPRTGTTFTFFDPLSGTSTALTNNLGFVADYGMDGWTVGTPGYFGDYYLPGDPQEGWAVEVSGVESDAYIPAYLGGATTGFTGSLAGTNTGYSAVGNIRQGLWQGTNGALKIRQTTTLDVNKLYFTVNVVLVNSAPTPMNNIYYIRTVDPDNEQTITGSFTTINTITYQMDAQSRVLVSATGTTYTNAYLGLGTKDCRAKCVFFDAGLAPSYSLDAIYNGTTPDHTALGSTSTDDVGIGLIYNIGNIAAGDSTELTYCYILNAAFIDSALNATSPPFLVNFSSFNSGDTVKLCTYNIDTATISIQGGGFYHWQWTPTYLLTNPTGYINVIHADSVVGNVTYTVVGINNAGGCDTSRSVITFFHDTLKLTVNNDTEICKGNFVVANTQGSNFTNYYWTPTATISNPNIKDPTFTPSVTTTYYVLDTSTPRCISRRDSFTIKVDSPATQRNISDSICLGSPYPVDFTVPGPDTGTNHYTYIWDPLNPAGVSNSIIPNPVITPTTPGLHIYTLNISPNSAGCTTTDLVTLFVLPNSISIHPHDTAVCRGQIVQVVGTGDPHFSYQWIPTAGIPLNTSLSPVINADTSAVYVITATFHLCPDMTDTLRLDVQPIPTVYAGGNRVFCQFDSVHITTDVQPHWYSGYIYSWTPSTFLDHNNTPTVVFTGNATTKEYVTVTTPAGCTAKDSALVTFTPGNFSTVIPNKDFCPHDSFQVVPVSTPAATYQWYPAFGVSDSNGSSPWIRPVASQVYTVVATTAAGCKDTLTFTAIVHPAGVLFLGDSVTLYPGETYQISPQTNCVTFQWFPPEGLNDPFASNPMASPEVSTNYVVTGLTEYGCPARDSISIYVQGESVIAIPNAFHPGSTGNNNVFKVIVRGEATLNYFRVYNRWGNLVFETTDMSKGWDGSYNGQPQPVGVFVYDVQAVSSAGTIITKHGNITLIR